MKSRQLRSPFVILFNFELIAWVWIILSIIFNSFWASWYPLSIAFLITISSSHSYFILLASHCISFNVITTHLISTLISLRVSLEMPFSDYPVISILFLWSYSMVVSSVYKTRFLSIPRLPFLLLLRLVTGSIKNWLSLLSWTHLWSNIVVHSQFFVLIY